MGKTIEDNFVPLWISFKTERQRAKEYGILRGPAFVVTDAQAKVQFTHRGMPFSKSDAAVKWFGEIPAKIKAVTDAEAKFKEKPDSNDARIAMAEAYGNAGRIDEALELYAKALESLAKDDKRLVDIQCHRASLAFQKSDAALATKLYSEVFPKLVETKDERGVEAGMAVAGFQRRNASEARETYLKVAATWPKHERVWEAKVMAALCVAAGKEPDFDTAKTELQAVVDNGPADDRWVKLAGTYIKSLEARQKKSTESRKPAEPKEPAPATPGKPQPEKAPTPSRSEPEDF